MTCKKRTFRGIGHVVTDLTQLAIRPHSLVKMATGHSELSPALREKIMLAITAVNQCRYCSFVHTQLALREGLSHAEIDDLLEGVVDDVSEDEREIILYAQHWADTCGHPDRGARERVIDKYGERRTKSFETAMRTIMFGNYFGNTFDSLLASATGGRLGQ